jgi:hypothetical protein
LAETPFIRIRDKGNALWLDYLVGTITGSVLDPDLSVTDQQPSINEMLAETRLQKQVELLLVGVIHLSVKLVVPQIYITARISKRSSNFRGGFSHLGLVLYESHPR